MDVTKLKTFADDKINVAKTTISVFDRKENTEEKGETSIFSFSHYVFKRLFFLGSLKVEIVW